MPFARTLDAAERAELVLLIGDAEAGLETNVRARGAKQVGAKGVQRATRDLRGGGPQPRDQPLCNLPRGLVGKREGADPRRVESVLLDQESNTLGEAVGLAGAGSGQDKQGAGFGLNRAALRGGRRGGGRRELENCGHTANLSNSPSGGQHCSLRRLPGKLYESIVERLFQRRATA